MVLQIFTAIISQCWVQIREMKSEETKKTNTLYSNFLVYNRLYNHNEMYTHFVLAKKDKNRQTHMKTAATRKWIVNKWHNTRYKSMKKQQKGQGTLSSSCYDSIKYLWHKMRWGDMGSKKIWQKKDIECPIKMLCLCLPMIWTRLIKSMSTNAKLTIGLLFFVLYCQSACLDSRLKTRVTSFFFSFWQKNNANFGIYFNLRCEIPSQKTDREKHRVLTEERPSFPIPCWIIFN